MLTFTHVLTLQHAELSGPLQLHYTSAGCAFFLWRMDTVPFGRSFQCLTSDTCARLSKQLKRNVQPDRITKSRKSWRCVKPKMTLMNGFIWIIEHLSHCIRKELDMWPYFCHNPTSVCEGGLYFYMTTQETCAILHAFLADMLPMIVLSVSLLISEK